MKPRLLVLDHVLSDPKKIIRSAKANKWAPTNNGDEQRLATPLAISIAKQIFSNTGLEFTYEGAIYTGIMRRTSSEMLNGRYRFRAHFDGGWPALIYLNEEDVGGTGFFQHKRTGLDGLHSLKLIRQALKRLNWTSEDLVDCLLHDETRADKWLQIGGIPSRFNRAIAFNGMMFHSHLAAPQASRNKARLTLNFYVGEKTPTKEFQTITRMIYRRFEVPKA